MENFNFTPDEIQSTEQTPAKAEFSFTPDDAQPDLSKVRGSDVSASRRPIELVANTAKQLLGRVIGNQAVLNVAVNVGKGMADNGDLISEYAGSLPKTFIGTGIKAGGTLREIGDVFSQKADEEELYEFQDRNQNDTLSAFGKELAKGSVGEVAVTTPKMVSDMAYWLGQNMKDPFNGQTNEMAEGFLALSDTFKNISDYMGDIDFFKAPEQSATGRMTLGQAGNVAGHGLGQGLCMAALGKTFGSKFAYGFYAAAGGAEVFKESYEKEGDLGKANTLAGLNTAATYMIDRWFDPLPENIASGARLTAKEVAKEIGKAAIKEPASESLQQVFAENLVRKIGIDAEQDLFEGVIESAIGALAGGVAMGGASAVAAYSAEAHYQQAKERAVQLGAEPMEVEQYKRATEEKLKQHPEAFNAVFQKNVDQTLKDINQFVKENGDTEEVRKALQMKADLEDVYTTVFESLKKAGVNENVANADAKVWQGFSLFAAQEFGVSPMEYLKQSMPKVEQSRFSDFENRGKSLGELLDDNIPFQSMYKSKLATVEDFVEDVLKSDDTSSRYFAAKTKSGVNFDLPRDIVLHDKKHALTSSEWKNVIDNLDRIENATLSPKKRFDGTTVLVKISTPDGKYGVAFEHMPKGRNIITTAFKDSDGNIDNWIKENSAKAMQTAPATQKGLLSSRSMSDIIANLDDNVNRSSYQLPPKAYKDGKADINTPEFKRWFGDSKVVDESGKPLVVYHGTNMEFSVFDKAKRGLTTAAESAQKGFFFTSSKDVAEDYAAYAAQGTYLWNKVEQLERSGNFEEAEKMTSQIENSELGFSEIIMPLYLSIKNPLIIDFRGKKFDAVNDNLSAYIDKAVKNHNDGVIFKNIIDNVYDETTQSDHYVVFEPNQIKSVYNRGGFSQENDNIYYQSAFHGSPYNELEGGHFSLEKIGTGESFAAHGYGLYYTSKFDIADLRYRRRLVQPYQKFVSFGDVVYNKKTKKYDNAFNSKSIEYEVYSDYIDAGKDYDTLIKSYKSLENINADIKDRIAIAKKYADKLDDAREFIDDSMATGQVYEVDLPENPYLLDEQLPVNQQSEHIRKVVRDIMNKYPDDYISSENYETGSFGDALTGGSFYKQLMFIAQRNGTSDKIEQMKFASKILEENGVKGIAYDGYQDGRCFVIFNPDDVKVIQKFYQDQEGRGGLPKGAFVENLDANGVIYLFEKADASTFMHESAHFWRKELMRMDSAKAKDMLQKMDNWENTEFDKRYKVVEQDGKFAVVGSLGEVVYDDFATPELARAYARNEIFARGFEQYLRDGKAPSNYLKQAFRSFWNWLRHLYKSATDLDVELSDTARSVYGDIIGGEDLDFYLTAPVDEVLQQHFTENAERKKVYDQQIALAQMQPVKRGFWKNVAQEKTDGAKGRNEWWNKAMVPISTRAKRINIKFRNKLRAYDYGTNIKLNQYYAQIKPFLDKWATMTDTDAVAFDLALKNSYVDKQLEIVNKYNAYDEFVAVKNVLNSLFDQAVDVGIEMGYSSDYFPRQIADVEGFMAAMYGSPMASQLRRALREADPDNVMTNEEKAEFFNKYLRGFNRRDLNKPLPGNVKDRTIDIVTAEMNKYYKPSMQALINYIDGMNTSIESRRFWGFKYDNIDQSIGALTADLIDKGLIKPEQDEEVQAILRARFKAKGVTNKWLNLQKNASYVYTMGGINSAITQIDDISVALYKAGFWNTVQSVFSKNRQGLSREELGLERIGQEFMEASTSSKAVNAVFKLTGLDKIDAFGKNTLINATFNKFQKMAETNEAALRQYLEPILEQETNQTIEDIKKGDITDNVRLLMFNELADMQPIALSEMPEWYLTSGNGRVFYMLKTFALKRIDIFRNECFDKFRAGQHKEAMQNLFRLSVLMIMCGSAKDAIIDMLFGRDFDFTDTMVNNLLGLAGISKYTLYKARDEGFAGFASSFAIPPIFASSSDLLSDIYKSLFSKKGKDIKDYEVWKGVPLIGRFYYWWLGGGRAKEERKKNKGKKLK